MTLLGVITANRVEAIVFFLGFLIKPKCLWIGLTVEIIVSPCWTIRLALLGASISFNLCNGLNSFPVTEEVSKYSISSKGYYPDIDLAFINAKSTRRTRFQSV